MPVDLLDAIAHAHSILGWYENLQESELPPETIWYLPDELERHFEVVRQKREAGLMGGPTRDLDDDDESESFMMKNEFARGRGRELE